MSEPHWQQRLPPEQRRRRIEDEEARREAERAADMARQREQAQGSDLHAYVSRRMARELEAILDDQRRAEGEELSQSGAAAPQNPYLLLILGVVISVELVALLFSMNRN